MPLCDQWAPWRSMFIISSSKSNISKSENAILNHGITQTDHQKETEWESEVWLLSWTTFVLEETCLSSGAARVRLVKSENVILNDGLIQTDHQKEMEWESDWGLVDELWPGFLNVTSHSGKTDGTDVSLLYSDKSELRTSRSFSPVSFYIVLY